MRLYGSWHVTGSIHVDCSDSNREHNLHVMPPLGIGSVVKLEFKSNLMEMVKKHWQWWYAKNRKIYFVDINSNK